MGWKNIFSDFFDPKKRAIRNVKDASDALNKGRPHVAIMLAERAMKQNPDLASPHDIIGMSHAVLAKETARARIFSGDKGAEEHDKKAVAAFQRAAQMGSKSARGQLAHWGIPLEAPKRRTEDMAIPWALTCENCQRNYLIGINCFAVTDDDMMQQGRGQVVLGKRSLKPDLIGSTKGYLPPPETLDPAQLEDHMAQRKAIVESLDSGTKRSWDCNTCGQKNNKYPPTPRWS